MQAIEIKGRAQHIVVRSHYAQNVPEWTQTDGRRLQMILFNVLGNAVKFSPSDSFIDFYISLVAGDKDNHSDTVTDTKKRKKGRMNWKEDKHHQQYLQIVVKDCGKGIPAEECPHISNHFVRCTARKRNPSMGEQGLGCR